MIESHGLKLREVSIHAAYFVPAYDICKCAYLGMQCDRCLTWQGMLSSTSVLVAVSPMKAVIEMHELQTSIPSSQTSGRSWMTTFKFSYFCSRISATDPIPPPTS